GELYVISDNSNFLYQYKIDQKELNPILVLDQSTNVDVPKKQKADFEAITTIDHTFYLFGSGSSKKRETLVKYHPETAEIHRVSLKKSYKALKRKFAISK